MTIDRETEIRNLLLPGGDNVNWDKLVGWYPEVERVTFPHSKYTYPEREDECSMYALVRILGERWYENKNVQRDMGEIPLTMLERHGYELIPNGETLQPNDLVCYGYPDATLDGIKIFHFGVVADEKGRVVQKLYQSGPVVVAPVDWFLKLPRSTEKMSPTPWVLRKAQMLDVRRTRP